MRKDKDLAKLFTPGSGTPRPCGRIEFRIIAGMLKGRKVEVPDLGVTRPPLTRLRRSIFDWLNPRLDQARYLDLYSGTGSYLFEAVSRGAAHAVGVEREPQLANAITSAAKSFNVSGQLQCITGDVFETITALAAKRERFDLVMVAPPQYQGLIGKTLEHLLKYPVIDHQSLVICQHDTNEKLGTDFSGWRVVERRVYGNTTFTVVRLA